jgi:hypothetical protein
MTSFETVGNDIDEEILYDYNYEFDAPKFCDFEELSYVETEYLSVPKINF